MPWTVWRRVRKRTLYFAPDYTANNPFQTMLHASLGPGITPVGVSGKVLVDSLASAEPGSIFHLHWTAPILQPATTRDAAERTLARFVDAVEGFQARGGKLLWSIHNALPHDARFRDLEVDLARFLADRADRIHVLSPETSDLVRNLFDLDPARTVVIEHCSYLGQYPNDVTVAEARRRLDLAVEDKVLVTLGGIRPYRGPDRLLDAFESIDDPAARLLIAGRPRTSDGDFAERLQRRCQANPRVRAVFERVRDEDLQVWLGAADVAVLPYLDILNSGGFWLAMTFGVPVVAPRAGALARFDGEPFVRLFDPDEADSLRQTLELALDDFAGNEAARAAARDLAESRRPAVMAAAYARLVDEVLR